VIEPEPEGRVAWVRVDVLRIEDDPTLFKIDVHARGMITREKATEILRAAADLFEMGGGTLGSQEDP
jgi:hypothetical protein